MPTVVTTTLILSLLFAQSPGHAKKTDREYDDLNGPVQIVRVESEDIREESAGPRNNGRVLERIALYDVNGRLTEQVLSFRSDCASSRHVFSDDAKGNRTEAVYWGKTLASDTKPDQSQSLASPLMYKQVFKLDNAGRRYEVDEYDDTGKVFGRTLYKYGETGHVEEMIERKGTGQLRCEFKYNANGQAIEQTCQNSSYGGRERSEFAYEYDSNSNWVMRTAKNSSVRPDGSFAESKKITYRGIKYYSPQADSVQRKADRVDLTELPPCTPMIIRKSGGVLQGSAIKRVEPSYPPNARSARIAGIVVVEVTVDEAGKVMAARAISGPPELREASVGAARGWEFSRTTLSKVPVKVIGTITFHFNL